ncbi:MAG: nuclear transport factor 2 family protein [Pseudomonadota bacterium]|nr:nuclear transport factor 2 family protein [Pseudomonadota bacterium]
MTEDFVSPQDAEDAFYDALDDRDAERMQRVWEDSADIACLLPMQPLVHGGDVHQVWKPLLEGDLRLDIQVRHIRWLEADGLAIHFVEERVSVPGQPQQPPVYATNVYRKGSAGWRMVLHQNSPTPPPPGAMPPLGMAPPAR